ncbi:MAG: hypothetical protein IJ341_12575 [Bacteroidales bacterium]|nr:hypothetical protein [Bacteroidales bacterium]
MESELHIPANIFEEMAGMKEIAPSKKQSVKENIKKEEKKPPINKTRLKNYSIALFHKIQKQLSASFLNLVKRFQSYQQETKTFDEKKDLKIVLKNPVAKAVYKTLAKNFEKWKPRLKKAWETLKTAVKTLFKLTKWLGKLVTKITKNLLKIFGKIAAKAKKIFIKSFKTIVKILLKISKFVFKMVKLVLKAIWKIVKKLFFRGKPAPKMFKDEPNDKAMEQPVIPKNKNKMKLNMKAVGKKSLFIMKVVKKMFKIVGSFLWKIIKKVFGKIIKKIITTIIKMIVKFIAGQVIGSIIPGIGNILMGLASMALMVMDVLDIINFIKETSQEINDIAKELKNEEEVDDDDIDEENEIADMNLAEVKKFMETLVSQNKENSEEYFEAKVKYLELLAESYAHAGDTASAEMIRLSMESGKVELDLNTATQSLTNREGIKSLDIKELEKALAEHQKQLASLKWENKAKNVFDESDLKVLLTGETDGGPMWISIWRDVIWYLKKNIPSRYPGLDTFEKIRQEVTAPYPKLLELYWNIPPSWTYEDREQRENRVAKGRDKILNEENYNYHDSSIDEFGEQDKFDTVIDRTNRYKFSLKEDSDRLGESKNKENLLQKQKYFKFEDVLKLLSTREQKTWTIDELLNNDEITWSARADLYRIKYGINV